MDNNNALRIYQTEITPEKNALIEDIDEFLETKCNQTYYIEKLQYQQIAANMVIKIAADQSKVGNAIGNYLRLRQDNRYYYFFIINASWKAQLTVELTISMDTLNTYANDLQFTNKTSVVREHKNRLELFDTSDTKIGSKQVKRIVDKQDEGIPVTDKLLKSKDKIADARTDADLDWFLMYKTRDSLTPTNYNNPIEISIFANKPLLYKKSSSTRPSKNYSVKDFDVGKYYYIDPVNNPGAVVKTINNTITLQDNQIIQVLNGEHSTGGREVRLYIINYRQAGNSYSVEEVESRLTGDHIEVVQAKEFRVATYDILNYTDIVNLQTRKIIDAGTQPDIKTLSFEEIDRTDSRIMKIIRLPYCPINASKNDNGEYVLNNSKWQYEGGLFKLKGDYTSAEFENVLGVDDITNKMLTTVNVSPKEDKTYDAESKMLHSAFTTYKYVYDSFAHDIKFENFDLSNYTGGPKISVGMEFKPTNTVNSTFAFSFNPDNATGVAYERKSDFDDYMIVNRNNEESILSNDYINYIRNGYNYDKKAKNMSLVQNILGIGSGALQSATGLGIDYYKNSEAWNGYRASLHASMERNKGAYTYSDAKVMQGGKLKFAAGTSNSFLTAGAINAGFGAVNNAINAIYSNIAAQDNINRKLTELGNQATNVQGSDDVDLMKYYSDNKLYKITYEPNDVLKKSIYELFYYAGYNCGAQEIPNLNSRYWFNYIQCNPVFKQENTSVYSSYLDDIRARFNNGVTIYHHHPEIDLGWDFDQEHENWETSLLNTDYLTSSKLDGHGFKLVTIEKNEQTYNMPIMVAKVDNNTATYTSYDVEWIDTNGDKHITQDIAPNSNGILMVSLITPTMIPWKVNSTIKAKRLDKYNHKLDSDWEIVYYKNNSN